MTIQCHIYNQSWVISVFNGLVKGEVDSSILEKDPNVFVSDARILGDVGMMAGGTVDMSGMDLTIRCLLFQLLGDSYVCSKLHIGQWDGALTQVNCVWWIVKLQGPELPWGF
jgi:hypothetical protein